MELSSKCSRRRSAKRGRLKFLFFKCPAALAGRTPAKARMIVLFYDRAARMLQPISDAASRAADWQLEEWRLGDSAARLEELLALAVVIVAPGLPAWRLEVLRDDCLPLRLRVDIL